MKSIVGRMRAGWVAGLDLCSSAKRVVLSCLFSSDHRGVIRASSVVAHGAAHVSVFLICVGSQGMAPAFLFRSAGNFVDGAFGDVSITVSDSGSFPARAYCPRAAWKTE